MSKFEFKATAFASLKDGGHLQVYQCVEYPDLVVTNKKQDRKSPWQRFITYKDREFKTLEEAKEFLEKREENE